MGLHSYKKGGGSGGGGTEIGSGSALPVADVSQVNKFFKLNGAIGEKDQLYICIKLADGNYDWVQIA